MIHLDSHPEGVLLSVRAAPGARRNAVGGEQNGALKVAVTQVAEKGKANKAVLDLLCKSLDLKKSQVELVSGETSRDKRVLVRGMTVEQLRERLARL
jgi:uncharacterized protein (TIGR00251 family)